jgi:hypothetical protein
MTLPFVVTRVTLGNADPTNPSPTSAVVPITTTGRLVIQWWVGCGFPWNHLLTRDEKKMHVTKKIIVATKTIGITVREPQDKSLQMLSSKTIN